MRTDFAHLRDQDADDALALLDCAIYPAAEAARLIDVTPTRVRRWLQGYQYPSASPRGDSEVVRQSPVVRRQGVADRTYASFLELIDLLFVKQFLDKGITLQKLRKALEEAAHIFGIQHFARETFFTDGRGIYLEVKEQGRAIMELLSGGHWIIASVIKQLADQIGFHETTGLAQRWFPEGRSVPIVIDPSVSFGRPSIVGRGIATANVYDFFLAENRRIPRVCSWMGLDQKEVKAAVAFEERLAA